MDEEKYTPTFLALLGIAEVLRDCVNDINEEFENAIEEVESVWNKL